MNPVKIDSFSLFHDDEAVEGLKGGIEGIKFARFAEILEMLVLLNALLILSEYSPKYIVRLHREGCCDQVVPPWLGANSADVLGESRCLPYLSAGKGRVVCLTHRILCCRVDSCRPRRGSIHKLRSPSSPP